MGICRPFFSLLHSSYWRTNLTQRMGWELRHIWHRTDWDLVKANPDLLKMKQPAWLFAADPELYAETVYDEVIECVKSGKPFTPTNVPEDYEPQHWSIADVMKMESGKF